MHKGQRLERNVQRKTELTFEEFPCHTQSVERCVKLISEAAMKVCEDVIASPPEIVEEAKLSLKGRWDIVQEMKLIFWKRWHTDYLSSLQSRNKWKNCNPNIKIGDVAIIKEDNIPPAVWPLEKVVSTHPGEDGIVRVVTLKTLKEIFKRPIVKPVQQE
ncbi:hypothetical protein AVEN_91262-1 [Araneus ventricosus]|uniref:DUF5641 domain-containing protein n=1 Tax=Araneus ventricosus TaxID=182803 RepID=A0A4Y2SZR6_ARAVE|nr:hypothetical protein AVEN_91262-1 [Araneus ventricosus]